MEPARKVYSYMNSVLNSVDLLHIFYNIHKENVPKKKQKNKKDYQKNAYGWFDLNSGPDPLEKGAKMSGRRNSGKKWGRRQYAAKELRFKSKAQ